MTNETDTLENTALVDAEAVADFLKNNPEFFVGRDSLLEDITLPHESGKAISLLERQVILLRTRADQQRNRIRELLDNANDNDALFEKTRILILALLKCHNLESLSKALNEVLGKQFDSVESHLFFITDNSDSFSGLATKSYTDAEKLLGEFFARKRTYCGALSEEQATFFFPDKPQTIASAAIVPVHLQHDQEPENNSALLPVLVTGSISADYFHGSQDTLFLDFIGEVLSALIGNLLQK